MPTITEEIKNSRSEDLLYFQNLVNHLPKSESEWQRFSILVAEL